VAADCKLRLRKARGHRPMVCCIHAG
jgi:hypothetical protein